MGRGVFVLSVSALFNASFKLDRSTSFMLEFKVFKTLSSPLLNCAKD